MTAARYVIRGRVQGVGFRWFVRVAATELGLRGSVRNLPDGSVEVVAGGSAEALATLERRLREGPPAARVTEIQAATAAVPSAPGFEIR